MRHLDHLMITAALAGALALPGTALAGQPPTYSTAASCASIEAKLAPYLDEQEETDLAAACATRDAAVVPARDARTAAHDVYLQARIAANDAYLKAVQAAEQLPAGSERREALVAARKVRREAIYAARTVYAPVAARAREDIHQARVAFRGTVNKLLEA